MHYLVSAGGGRWIGASLVASASVAALALGVASPASAAVPHVVQPGESLWSIAAASNLTTRTVAVFNGLAEDAYVVEGQTIQVPTVEEGAAALANAGITPGSSTAVTTASGVAHTVQPGESLSSVAAANGITIDALAAANGLAPHSFLIAGATITIPGASGTATTASDTYGLGHIPSPSGELHLDPAAAASWNAMREQSLATFGVDIYPGGPLSAYRTYEEQAALYQQYLEGTGAPANPPGTSTHELGIAVDVPDPAMREVVDQLGAAYGWVGTIPSEWWHVEYVG